MHQTHFLTPTSEQYLAQRSAIGAKQFACVVLWLVAGIAWAGVL